MDLKSTYNKIARDWMKNHHEDTWWIEGTKKYLSFLKLGATILDIGCGAGIKSKYIADQGFSVTGIDFSEEMIKIAKEQASSEKFLVRDIRQPLKLGELFDGVFAQAVLLHFPKREIVTILRNITEPLKSGGYLYAAVKKLCPNGKEEENLKEDNYGYAYERFFSYFTINELKNYIIQAGLRIVYENVVSSGKTNWLQIIAQK